MSQKTFKKIRKEARRQVDHNFGTGMQALAKLVRKRPKYIPRFVWIIIYAPLFKFRYLKAVYKSI